jgi:serine/threonine-protein kinase
MVRTARTCIAARLIALVAILSTAGARPARAAGDDVATAQVLFEDGKRLMARGKWTEACPKLEDSQRLAPGIGTEFNLADCFEHEGRFASAWVAFIDVVDRTHKRGESQRETLARTRADALAGKLGKLTIQVSAPPPDLEVRRDGQIVRPEALGVAMPADAGEHHVEARARGRVTWKGTVTTKNGEAAFLAIPELGVAAASASGVDRSALRADSPSPEPEEPATSDAPPAPPPAPPPHADHTAAAVVLGASVVFAGVGALGLIEHGSSVSSYNADPTCPGIQSAALPAECSSYVSAASTWNTVGIVGFVGAGAALLTGITLWVVAPTHAAASTSRLTCAPGLGTVTCGGQF